MGKKAQDPVVLKVMDFVYYADYFIVLTGTSDRHVKAIAEAVDEELKKIKARPLHLEGMEECSWVLMDLDDVIVHIFQPEIRSFYDLEGLWLDAPREKISI